MDDRGYSRINTKFTIKTMLAQLKINRYWYWNKLPRRNQVNLGYHGNVKSTLT